MVAGAFLYYQRHWWGNRLRNRIRHLRQPKYLAGAAALAFFLACYIWYGTGHGFVRPRVSPAQEELAKSVAEVFLLILVLLAWLLPHTRAAVNFSEAEVDFFFTAPVSREALIHYKLIRSQFIILVGAMFMTTVGRSWGGGNFVIRALGWWIFFATFNLHLLASSFALNHLMNRGLSNPRRRAVIITLAVLFLGGMFFWLFRTMPPHPPIQPNLRDWNWVDGYTQQVLHSGPLPYLLIPFRIVVAPYFALTGSQFLQALWPALALMALHYAWVIHANVAFEEASAESARKMAERMHAFRSGHWRRARRVIRPRRPPFRLREGKYPGVALYWKNLISTGRLIRARSWVVVLTIVLVVGIFLRVEGPRAGSAGPFLAFLALALAAMSLLWGPQLLRSDLRQDLLAAEILKLLPLPGWQIFLGEVAAPALVLASCQWLMVLTAFLLLPGVIGPWHIPLSTRALGAVAAGLLLPCIDLIAMIIPNGLVLSFPEWFQLGKEVPRGFETACQQVVLVFGQIAVLALSLTPAAAVYALIFWRHHPLMSLNAGLVTGAAVGAVFLSLEAVVALRLFGAEFESMDLSKEILSQN